MKSKRIIIVVIIFGVIFLSISMFASLIKDGMFPVITETACNINNERSYCDSYNELVELKLEAASLGIDVQKVLNTQDTYVEQVAFLQGIIKKEEEQESTKNEVNGEYTIVEVDPCDTSGEREANVVVDVGYDSSYATREYYAYTNEYSQVVTVTAEELILQDDSETLDNDRYCKDEAKVNGVESETLDEGHVIADSLGGVSNAYNITPQDSDLNRQGEQAEMEEEIRTALESGKEVTNFYAEIIYANTTTQIPSSYYFSYDINGKTTTHSFENGENKEEKRTKRRNNEEASSEPQFSSCSERAENGYNAPITSDMPEYDWYNDGDSDGIVCE